MAQPRSPVPLVLVGLGPIGRSALSFATQSPGFTLVAACDAHPELAGKALARLVSGAAEDIRVVGSIAELPPAPEGAVAVLCTTSRVPAIQRPLEALVDRGYHVVSSCEELTWPWLRHADWSQRLDERARQRHVAVLGTGINPGFLMDLLPVILRSPCVEVRGVRVERVVDASTRRGPLQRKVGAGQSVEEFQKRVAAEQLGHVGLAESAAVVCAGLGWDVPDIREDLDPVIATHAIETAFVSVQPGQAAGIHHRIEASTPQGRVELDLKMFVGAIDPVDRIMLDSDPPVHCTLEGGVGGDLGTVGVLLRTAPLLPHLAHGLRTVLDCPAAPPR